MQVKAKTVASAYESPGTAADALRLDSRISSSNHKVQDGMLKLSSFSSLPREGTIAILHTITVTV